MEKGIEKGIERGMEKSKVEIATKFLSIGLSAKQVAEGTGLNIEEVKKLQEQMYVK